MLGQAGVLAGDAAVGQPGGGLAAEPAGQPREAGVARDPDRGQARDLAGVLAERRLGHLQHQQVKRRVGPEDGRVRGVIARDVARAQRGRPMLLGAVQPAPQHDLDVHALRIAGRDVLGGSPHRVGPGGDPVDADVSEAICPHPGPEPVGPVGPDVEWVIGVA